MSKRFQEEIDSSNLLLFLMKRIEDVIILRFISLVKFYYQIIRLEQFHSHSFLESLSNCIKAIEKDISVIR